MLPKKVERKKRKTETFLGVCFISEPFRSRSILQFATIFWSTFFHALITPHLAIILRKDPNGNRSFRPGYLAPYFRVI